MMLFSRTPIDWIVMATLSPSCSVNSGWGTIEVPVRTVVKSGTKLLSWSHWLISVHVLAISPVDVESWNTSSSFRYIEHSTSKLWGSGILFAVTKQGPIEQLLSYTLAWGRYSGFSPSMDRLLISLPIVYPIMSPFQVIGAILLLGSIILLSRENRFGQAQ